MQKLLTLTAICFLILLSCAEKVEEKTPINNKKDSKNEETEVEPKKEVDTLPNHDFIKGYDYTAKILSTGIFHQEEVWKNAHKGIWYGVFENENGYYLSETLLKIKRVNNQVTDGKNQKTGWEIKTSNKDNSLILIQGLNFLKNRKIKQIKLEKQEMNPGETLFFNFLGTDYKLVATADQTPHEDFPEMIIIKNYKLTLTSLKDGVELNDVLVTKDGFSEAMIDIEFAGDIDGDGRLDLIVNTSNHYNVTEPTLYLSKPAKGDKLLKIVGQHTTTGC